MHNKCSIKTIKALSVFGSATILVLMCGTSVLADTLLVDDDKTECPEAGFKHIQNAVNHAARGDIIEVCPGIYDEQITIAKPLTLVGVAREGKKAAVVQPSNMTANATDTFGSPIAAAILVKGTSDVTIRNIIVDGINNGVGCEQPPEGTDPFLDGIFYRNSSGEIQSVAVRNIISPQGCAQAFAIDFEGSDQVTAQLTVRDSSVHDYDQLGILADGPGLSLHALRNVITGNAPSDKLNGQTGIQLGFGAQGSIEDNIISNHIIASCISTSECEFSGTGIMAFLTAEDVKIVRNVVGKTQTGIFVIGTGVSVLENRVSDTDVFDGIAVIGDNNTLKDNIITNSDESGVFVQGANNTLQDNTINEAPVGLLVTADNNFFGNRLFNTPVTKEVFDPGASAGSNHGPSRPGVIPSSVLRRGSPR